MNLQRQLAFESLGHYPSSATERRELMSGLVLFIHGLTGDKHTWGAVPDFVQRSPLAPDFAIATLEYSAKLRSPSDTETSASRLLTEIQTRYQSHDPIYLVGHSLGGLVAREICRKLLVHGPDEILSKIPAVITVGTPLEGARIGNWFLRCLPLFSKKINQLADPTHTFDAYREAIRIGRTRGVSGPKQLHLRIEDDTVIASQIQARFTHDDVDAGVIPGTHTNFAERNDDASYVAEVLLTQIRNTENSLSRPTIRQREALPQPQVAAPAALPDRLILIACSHGKKSGGTQEYTGPPPAQWMPQPQLRQRLISKRSYVLSVLYDAKLADGFERGGNRAHQPANRDLKHGPDLGGPDVIGVNAQYMPAWRRYNGRIYLAAQECDWHSYFQNTSRVRVLIMSGLYGFLQPDESIQNYDVHLTDTHTENGQSVSSMWSDIFTESISAYINHAFQGRKVNIFNLLGDHHYVDSIHWHALPKECSVFHLASPTIEDVELLPPAGTILRHFLANASEMENIERDSIEYEISKFGAPPPGMADLKVIFESRVGLSKK